MKNLVLHVGHPKTGSSYLQSFLTINEDKLKKSNIHYPTPNKNDLNNSIKGFVTSGNGSRFLDSTNNLIFNFNDKITTLFSDECFFYRLLGWDDFDKFFKKNAIRLKVILYTRNLFECSISDWGQLIKRHYFTEDINTFLINSNTKRCNALKDWIEASIKYNFDLKIRNYSNNKKNLANVFCEDLGIGDIQTNDFKMPPIKNVNRSLTISEYEIVRVLNIVKPQVNLADRLVNFAPDIKPEKILISRLAYEAVVNKNLKLIKEINNNLNVKEQIKIESIDEVCDEENSLNRSFLNQRQIEITSNYLINSFIKDKSLYNTDDAPILLKISDKIEKNKNSLSLDDSLELLKICKKMRPEGPNIMIQFRRIIRILKNLNYKPLYQENKKK